MLINPNQNFKLQLNTSKKVKLLQHRNDINFSKNYIISPTMESYEIDNYTAFNLLQHKLIPNIEHKKIKTRWLEADPDKVIDRIRNMIEEGFFAASHS